MEMAGGRLDVQTWTAQGKPGCEDADCGREYIGIVPDVAVDQVT